jgi:hypothetical protein
MRVVRLEQALTAIVAAVLALLPSPCAAQAVEPRLVVFEEFMRPT